MLIDTHTHIYLPDFAEDRDAMMTRAFDKGIKKLFLPAIDSNHTTEMLDLEARYPENCFLMMGLHPCSVKQNYEMELLHVESWLEKRKFSAIGEIGLDFYWDKTFVMEQYHCFEKQMELALLYNLPIVIHSRNATQECIDTVKPFSERGLRGIFHCFGGTLDEANQIIDLNFKLGIGGVLTYKNSGLDKVVEQISLEHIVLETDSPYLTPQPFRGKRNESSYLLYVAEKLSMIKSISLEEIAEVTTRNALTIFR